MYTADDPSTPPPIRHADSFAFITICGQHHLHEQTDTRNAPGLHNMPCYTPSCHERIRHNVASTYSPSLAWLYIRTTTGSAGYARDRGRMPCRSAPSTLCFIQVCTNMQVGGSCSARDCIASLITLQYSSGQPPAVQETTPQQCMPCLTPLGTCMG